MKIFIGSATLLIELKIIENTNPDTPLIVQFSNFFIKTLIYSIS